MKKILFMLSLLMIIKTSNAQITYFDYLDYTSEWRSYGGGWNEVYFIEEYTTTYFDGDTTINGNTYYKRYVYSNTNMYTSPTFNLYLTGPTFIREDNNKNFYEYSVLTNTETVAFDNQLVIAGTLGSPYPELNANCSIILIDTIYLGTRPLKHIRGINYTPSGQLEGVGTVGASCALAVEGSVNLVCYTKSGQNIQFNSMDCNLFPTPLRTNLTTAIPEKLNNPEFYIYPNPNNGSFIIDVGNIENATIEIYNISGQLILKENFWKSNTPINLKENSKGIYFVKIETENKVIVRKIAYQ
ncbi:MAG: T9SS type A sorting domain-containing protein [Vicingaceae bacterium]|nr:T9SS type A sorting domain-containing protein [Vicingaceae bacterium]